MREKKFILKEQTFAECGPTPADKEDIKLPSRYQSGALPYADTAYNNCTFCYKTEGGTQVRYARCPKGAEATITTGLEKYVGKYEGGSGISKKVAEFFIDGSNLFMTFQGGINYRLNSSGVPDVFTNEEDGIRVSYFDSQKEIEIDFEELPLSTLYGSGNKLKRTSRETSRGGGTSPRIDLRQKYDTSGDFGCLELVRRELNRFPFLYREENGNRLAYEYLSTIVDGSSTELEYNKDKTVFWRKRSEDHDILKKGTWECVGGGYIITWEDGKKTTFGVDDVDINGSSAPNSSSQSTSNNSSSTVKLTSCKSGYNIPCPDEQDVLDGKASWRACMSCDKIQELQEIPALKDKIERIQTRDGKTITTDIYFGPIMEEAVILLQAERGLTPDGKIGEMTYNELLSNPGISSTSSGKTTGASTTTTTTTTTPTPKSQTKPSQPIRKVNIFDPNADY